jgi:hypothetical protein
MAHERDAEGGDRPLRISITVNDQYRFDTPAVMGRQIKERAGIPADFALYRRTRGGNESIRDEDPIELHDGDHFFARPSGPHPAPSDDQEGVSK